MDKIDFVADDKDLYAPKAEPELVDVPTLPYLMYDGRGIPEHNPEFQRAFHALYGVAYGLKSLAKRGRLSNNRRDFKVPPPEGLWWTEGDKSFMEAKREDWHWTLMIRMPEWVTPKLVQQVVTELMAKKKDDVFRGVRFEELAEGKSVQLMHVGPYDTEDADLAKMATFTETAGMHYRGKHHEIYFGDPRRTKPKKLHTILRHPVKT